MTDMQAGDRQRRLTRGGQLFIALLAGALLPLAFAPLQFWPLALLSPALLACLMRGRHLRATAVLGFVFGLGLFGVGASWVYVSIHQFGGASLPLAILLTGLFVAFLSAFFCLPFCLLASLNTLPTGGHFAAFSALWVLGEWLRSWVFTGFPWLLLGYSQASTPVSGWAPVGGIFALSLLTVAISCSLAMAVITPRWRARLLSLLLAFCLGGSGFYWQHRQWTRVATENISVALVQPNIAQQNKWKPEYLGPSLDQLRSLSAGAWQADWVIWPEAAVPLLYHRALPFLEQMHSRAAASDSALITGILYDHRNTEGRADFYNSLIGLGRATGVYHKTRLVPFGEYVPLEDWLRGLIDFFNLPTSFISAGDARQPGLQVGAHRLATAICYEIVYPDLVAHNSRGRAAIITVSNDAWFGSSWGPLQHLQMARMRARETGRYVIRATNNGISAIIRPDGSLASRGPQFETAVVLGAIKPISGDTPFMRYGSTPVIAFAGLLLALLAGLSRVRRFPA